MPYNVICQINLSKAERKESIHISKEKCRENMV